MANETRFQVKFGSDGAGGLRAEIESMGKTAKQAAADLKDAESRAYDLGQTIATSMKWAGGVAAAGIALIVKNTIDAQNEQAQLAAVLKSTGNAAGWTAEQLNALSDKMSKGTNFSGGDITKAETRLLSYSNIVGETFPRALQAAIDQSARLGIGIEQSAEIVGRALGEPTKAMAALAQQGFSFDAQQKKVIKALEDSGRTAEAQAMILDMLEESYSGAAAAARDTFGGSLSALKNALADLMTGGDGSLDGTRQSIEELTKTLSDPATKQAFENIITGAAAATNALALLISKAALLPEMFTADDKKSATYWENIKRQTEQRIAYTRTSSDPTVSIPRAIYGADRLTDVDRKALAQANAELERIRKANAPKVLMSDETSIPESMLKAQTAPVTIKGKTDKGLASATRSAALQDYRDQSQTELAAVQAQTQVLQAQYQAREISASDYYTQLRTLTAQGTNAEAAAIQKQIAYLQQQNVTGKDAVNVQKQIGKLEADLAKVRGDGAAKLQVLSIQERQAEQDRKDAIATYKAALQSSTAALEGQMQAMVLRVGLGDREYEVQQKVNDVYKEQSRLLADLALQKSTGKIDADVAKANEANIKQEAAAQVQAILDGYATLDKAQSDWKNGAAAAWMNYLTDATNVAGQMQSAFTGAFSGLEDAFVKFVQTGKLSFSDLANSIIADLARIAAKQAITGIFGSAFNAVLGSTIGGVSKEAIPVSSAFSLGGGRATGGDVVPGKLYPVGETGRPEILEQNGIKYLIPGAGGTVTPAGMAAVGGGGISGGVNVSIHNAPAGTTAEASAKQNANGGFDIAVILKAVRKDIANDLASGGTTMSAIKGRLDVKERV